MDAVVKRTDSFIGPRSRFDGMSLNILVVGLEAVDG